MGDEGMTYEDMLRLAEVMGQHKPPTATKEEIAKSALQIVKSEAVAGLHEQGKVLDITADRCLGEPDCHHISEASVNEG